MIIVPPTQGKVQLDSLAVGTACQMDDGTTLMVDNGSPDQPGNVAAVDLATGLLGNYGGSAMVTAYPSAAVVLTGPPPTASTARAPTAAASSGPRPAPVNPRVGR